MLKFDQFELYNILFKTLKKVYLGDLYLVIESIEFDLNEDEEDSVLALNPWGYTVKGRYGRETGEPQLNETFSLLLNFDDSFESISGKFEELIHRLN